MQTIQQMLNKGVDIILPPRCPVTGELVSHQGAVAPNAWAQLQFITHPFCIKCGIPFGFGEEEDGLRCMSCVETPPIYESARAALIYDETSRDLILGFKHGDKTHMAPSFIPWLTRAGAEMLEQADLLVPVPLHHSRLFIRRYNQAALIADALAKETGIKHLPMALKRTRATPSQGYLKTEERRKNVKSAFIAYAKYISSLKGKSVILIDDVYTTGATVEECTKTLLKAGVSNVHILTLARVLKD